MRIQLFCFKSLPLCIAALFFLAAGNGTAQNGDRKTSFPLTVSVFSESVSLPNFRGLFNGPGWGVRIGTEFYYGRNENRRLLQTLNVGYYRHDGLQQGLFLSSELGYRKFFGDFFADATIGAGYLRLVSALKRYEAAGENYRSASPSLHKIMPTLGLGAGYRFGELTIFSRFEAFGEMPFSYGGSPVLPHKTLHLGARFQP